jgi:serine/threonine-protein kinase
VAKPHHDPVSSTTRIGTSVAGYRIESLLGRGGMSVVYLAEHERLGRKVALKLLTPALGADADFRERFERESRRAAEIDHPNIVPIYDAGEAEGLLYIAMRYVNGGDLKGVIARDGPLGLGRTLFILEQAASGLDTAHDHGLVHRDVKPANILIEDPSERVFVTDFGVAKHTSTPGLTRTGLFIGTVDYAAPEQIEGMTVDARTDVYALGCVTFEALTGRPPFVREGEVAVMHAHIAEPPPSLSPVRPDLPRALDRVLATAMAKAREDRYSTCGEFVHAARAAALQLPSTAPPELARSEAVVLVPPAAPDTDGAPSAERPAVEPVSVAGPAEAAPASPAAPTGADSTGATAAQAAPPAGATVADEAATAGRRGEPTGGKRSTWVLAAGLAILAAAVSGGLVYLLSGDNGASTQASSPPPPASPGSPVVEEEPANLQTVVPAQLYRDCATASTPQPGAISTLVCLPSDTSVRNRPDRWQLSSYPSGAAAEQAFDAYVEDNAVERDSGTCSGTSWGGEGDWTHGSGDRGGSRVCFFDDANNAVVVWTHEKLGQPTHADVIGVAQLSGANHASLFSWWRFWVHRIGKTQ